MSDSTGGKLTVKKAFLKVEAVLTADITDWILRVASVAAIVSVVALAHGQREQQRCFEQYVNASAESTQARAAAAEVDRQSMDRLFQNVAAHPDTAINYIQEYNLSRAITDKQRAEHPVPGPPTTTCKDN